MKLTNTQIKQLMESIVELEKKHASLPFRLTYCIIKNKKPLIDAYTDIKDMTVKLCEKYGTINEAGDRYDFEPDKLKLFNLDLMELLNTEVELQLYTVDIEIVEQWSEALEKQGRTGLTMKEVASLMFILNTADNVE